ncbi:MAG: hypothetical protein DRO11_02165 [Methanobacteriota archaeon]|nr:MAG: hypothetical protein DRO11_02165 [Euryarchaeota archaeon]
MPTKKETQADEINKLKGRIFDLNERINTVVAELNKMATYFEFHGHPTTLMSGKPFFLEEQYKQSVENRTPPTSEENPEGE